MPCVLVDSRQPSITVSNRFLHIRKKWNAESEARAKNDIINVAQTRAVDKEDISSSCVKLYDPLLDGDVRMLPRSPSKRWERLIAYRTEDWALYIGQELVYDVHRRHRATHYYYTLYGLVSNKLVRNVCIQHTLPWKVEGLRKCLL